jgi:hypothetical protein
LSTINLEELMPLEVDDEMIFEHNVLPQPEDQISLTTGFNIHSRVFWAALKSPHGNEAQTLMPESGNFLRSRDPTLQLVHLKDRLHDVKYIIDDIPSELRPWDAIWLDDSSSGTPESRKILKAQFASMRANLHVTHLWLQSILLDQIDILLLNKSSATTDDSNKNDLKLRWHDREDICRQLLHVLYGIPEAYLEPNGHHLVQIQPNMLY